MHANAVKPALHLLRAPEYKGAEAEFLSAHEHYRHGRFKEAMVDSLKAFESTMKAICKKKGWPTRPTDTASQLIEVILKNGVVNSFWQSHFSALRSTLEAGIPTARNKLAGHGQGVEVLEVPRHLASYILHLTASTVLFLAESAE